MDRRTLDTALPMIFALLIVICSLWIKNAIAGVAIVGGMLLGMYFAVARPRMTQGRERDRRRNR